jgi:hypothetical protein
MIRSLAMIVIGLLLLIQPAQAGTNTYCVGGFEFVAGFSSRRACATHANIHRSWHFHVYVQGPDGLCRECWDEEDNTCDTTFLRQHPDFHTISRYACQRATAAPPESVQIRLENGTAVSGPPPGAPPGGGGVPSGAPPGGGSLPTAEPESYTPPPPPPPPPPVNLNAEITRLSTGPYGAGDSVRVTAQVITSSGKLRPAQAGEIIVRGPDGRERARVPVRPLPSGQVVALVKLPENTVGNLQLEFVPRGIALQVDETMGTVTGKQHSLRLSSCRLRGHILEPTRGEVVVPESIILLSGELRDKAGQKVSASTLSVLTKPIFIAERADGQTQRHNGSVEADGKISGRMWLKPTSADSEEVLLHLIGEGGPDGELCSAGTTALKLTKLGIGLEILEPQPDGICYTGKPCRVVAQFKLPSSGDAKRNAEAWLRTPGLTLIAKINGDPVTILRPTTLPNGRQAYADSFMPKHPLSMEIEVVVKAGGQEVSDRQRVTIREPIALKLPSELDLGQVPVGSSWRINCGKIDFSKSTGVDEQEFQFHVELPPGCKSELGIADAFGRFLPFASSGAAGDSGDRRLVLGLDRSVKLCLTPPRCAGEKLAPAIVKIKPTSPEFATEQAVVAVKWQVKGRGFLLCNLWWLSGLGGGLLLLLIVLGFLRPYQFGIDDSVKIATKKDGLQRAVARRLRDLPGGRAGFYRSAATGLREDGSATDRLRTAQLSLHAYKGEILLRCHGSLQRMNPQTRKLDPVEVPSDGYALSRNTVYQVGTLFFQIS